MDPNFAVLAGTVSTVLFMISTFPMLYKAIRSKDLRSYSFGNMLLANCGNAVHSLYVYSLPQGPIWWLHSFHLVTTGLMLTWYLRFERRPGRARFAARLRELGDSAVVATGSSRPVRPAGDNAPHHTDAPLPAA